MSWITLSQNERVILREPPDSSLYEVTMRVVDSNDIEPEIFVMATNTEDFQHVALVADMLTWPIGRQAALEAGSDYFRVRQFSKTYTSKEKAAAFATHTRNRVESLNRLWSIDTGTAFGGETTYVYNSEST